MGPNRLDGHAEVVGPAQTADEYDIAFDVYSERNQCAGADLVPATGRRAWGVVYEIPDDFIRGRRNDGQKTLEQIEGSKYHETQITVRMPSGEETAMITFVVRPNERRQGLCVGVWYVSWIVYGLRAEGVPEEYVQHVADVAIDTNQRAGAVAEKHTQLIRNL